MSNGARRLLLAAALGGAVVGLGASPTAEVAAQSCHPAYGGCLPYYEWDALNCADIGYQVVQVWDVNWDPYNLDALYRPGNGWTCDGIG
ncbi:MAG: hypothetical protein QM692_08150 [Thermomicrobiales bacterium]